MTVTVLNGQLPASMLVTVGTDAYGRPAQFQPNAAASWNRMRAAGMPHDVSDTYRDLARQWDYYLDPPNSAGLAAYPGTSSHGEGLAVDARGKCLDWLAEHGKAHGWIRTIAKEPWHFVYHPGRDQYVGAGGGATITTPPIVKDWFDMATKAELEQIIRRADFIRFTLAAKPGVRCEASMAAGTWRVYRTEAEITARENVLRSREWVIEDWPHPVVNPDAFGARLYNAWETRPTTA